MFYGNEAPDGPEMDAVWDEMRTLRVKLNQMTNGNRPEGQSAYMASAPGQHNYAVPPAGRSMYGPPMQQNYVAQPVVQPAYMAQTQVQASPSGVIDDQAFNVNFARAMMNFMNANSGSSEQFVTTRGGRDTGPQSGQGF